MPWGHTVDKEIQCNYATVQLKHQTLTPEICKHYKHLQLFFIFSLKEHGKSCIGIFYQKYCVSHIPWHNCVHIYCVK